MKSRRKIAFLILAALLTLPMLFPATLIIPVEGAIYRDWNKDSFWHYPWGKSGTHKGIDIFAPEGQNVLSSATGIVIYSGEIGMGGNVVAVLGAKWRVYYYAHLQSYQVNAGEWGNKSSVIGQVGATGNAAGKPPHLHFSITSLLPLPWRWDNDPQGWKKMFYLNPNELLWKSIGKNGNDLNR